MANIKSQKKRILITKEENASNAAKRSRVKNAIKKFVTAIEAKDITLAESLLPTTVSLIDKSGVYPDNTASRKVARLSRMLSDLKSAK